MKKHQANSSGIARYEAIIQAANNGQLWGLDFFKPKSRKILISNFH